MDGGGGGGGCGGGGGAEKEDDAGDFDFSETKLTLCPPGESNGDVYDGFTDEHSAICAYPAIRAEEVAGWPPVGSFRRRSMPSGNRRYVKVAMDGVPYLRKVDLEMYSSYPQMLDALEELFSTFMAGSITAGIGVAGGRFYNHTSGRVEYIPTYEDKEGDLLLVGDVPWSAFVETCHRLRLMKNPESTKLGPSTPPRNGSKGKGGQ